MKTDLELALECAVNVFHQYALLQRPIDDYLSKDEFSKLLKQTAEPFLRNTLPVRPPGPRGWGLGDPLVPGIFGQGRFPQDWDAPSSPNPALGASHGHGERFGAFPKAQGRDFRGSGSAG